MEVFATAVLEEISTANADLRKALDGLDDLALNWRPTGKETNSLYVLASHMVGVQRNMISLALRVTIQRDRAEEFRASGPSVAVLVDALANAEAEISRWLEQITPAMLGDKRTFLNGEITVASCLARAARHLGEHSGHAGLTRQLLDQR